MRGSKRSTNGFPLLAAITVVATLTAWIFLFRLYEDNFGSALSGNQAAWGAFGQYIGGLLTPILGTFTLVGVFTSPTSKETSLRRLGEPEEAKTATSTKQVSSASFFACSIRSTRTSSRVRSSSGPENCGSRRRRRCSLAATGRGRRRRDKGPEGIRPVHKNIRRAGAAADSSRRLSGPRP